MPLPFEGNDVRQYVLALRDSGDPENLAHARKVVAMFAVPGKLREFRELCVPIPVVPRGSGWALKHPADRARIEAAAGSAAGRNPALVDHLLAAASQNFTPRQPLMPAAMLEGGVWLIVYDSTKLSGQPTPHAESHPAFYMGNTDPQMLKMLVMMGQGKQNSQDPVERFYFHQIRTQE